MFCTTCQAFLFFYFQFFYVHIAYWLYEERDRILFHGTGTTGIHHLYRGDGGKIHTLHLPTLCTLSLTPEGNIPRKDQEAMSTSHYL